MGLQKFFELTEFELLLYLLVPLSRDMMEVFTCNCFLASGVFHHLGGYGKAATTCNQSSRTQEVSVSLKYCFPIYTLLFFTTFPHMLMCHKSYWLLHSSVLCSGCNFILHL